VTGFCQGRSQSSNGLTDEPHPRFLVQGHKLSVVGGDALLFPHNFTPQPTEHQLCTLGTYGSCQSQLTIIHVAILDCLCTGENWTFFFLGTWGCCQVCPPSIPFGVLLLHQQRTAVSFKSVWSPPGCFQLVVSWLKKLINPLSVFRHISCFFFLDSPPHPWQYW